MFKTATKRVNEWYGDTMNKNIKQCTTKKVLNWEYINRDNSIAFILLNLFLMLVYLCMKGVENQRKQEGISWPAAAVHTWNSYENKFKVSHIVFTFRFTVTQIFQLVFGCFNECMCVYCNRKLQKTKDSFHIQNAGDKQWHAIQHFCETKNEEKILLA